MSDFSPHKIVQADPWHSLRAFTAARIALGRTGTALPLKEILDFKLAHADARDAVYSVLDKDELHNKFASIGEELIEVKTRAKDRAEYLQRPDLGRAVSEIELANLQDIVAQQGRPQTGSAGYDIVIILADGLSATAINRHAFPVVEKLLKSFKELKYTVAPIILVEQGRVAVGDVLGAAIDARLSLVFIGERPGLSSSDSLGLYMTLNPKPGLTDESRNCVSNIRPEGLGYELATAKIMYLVRSAFAIGISGVGLKEGNELIG